MLYIDLYLALFPCLNHIRDTTSKCVSRMSSVLQNLSHEKVYFFGLYTGSWYKEGPQIAPSSCYETPVTCVTPTRSTLTQQETKTAKTGRFDHGWWGTPGPV